MKVISRLGLAVSVLATGFAVSPTTATAAPVPGCGSVVTANVTLTADIIGCTGDGLVVGRDGITIDLGDHKIQGSEYWDLAAPGTVGVRIGSHKRVTVKGKVADPMALANNEITGFETAVLLEKGAKKNTVKRLNLRGRRFGVALRGADDNTLERNSISFAGGERPEPCEPGPDAEAGIVLRDSDNNTVRGNTAQLGMFGILLHNSDGNTVENNQAAPLWSDGNQCDGIALFASNDNKVVRNIAANDVPHGIWVARDSARNAVKRNILFQNGGDGLLVENNKTTLSANEATNNQGWGINAVKGVTAAGNKAAGNFGPGQCRNVTCQAATPPE
jgi:parallel beta-helix repeat protein